MHIKNSIIWMVDHSHFESCYYFFLVFFLFLFFFKGIRNVKNPNPSPNPNPRTKKGRKGWMPPPPPPQTVQTILLAQMDLHLKSLKEETLNFKCINIHFLLYPI